VTHHIKDTPDSVAALVESIQEGEDVEESFEKLFRLFYPRIYRSFPATVGAEDRSDLTQDVFIRVYRCIGRAPADEERFAAWIHRIAKNLYLNWLRYWKAGQRDAPLVSLSGEVAPLRALGSDRQTLSRELEDMLGHALSQLTRRQRTCLLLHIQGYSNQEIATATGRSVETVKTHLKAARRSLKSNTGYLLGPADFGTS
jgi:RNA polymerase sigma-70 factor (ECF subfamily)